MEGGESVRPYPVGSEAGLGMMGETMAMNEQVPVVESDHMAKTVHVLELEQVI
jgi:hypothetical protein